MDTPMDQPMGNRSPGGPSHINKPTGSNRLTKRVRPIDGVVWVVLLFCGVVSIFTTMGIVGVLGQETILFFGSRAFTAAKIPVIDSAEFATVQSAIDADNTVLVVDDVDNDLAEESFVLVNNEIMQVESIAPRPIVLQVERGLEETTARTFDAETPIFVIETATIAEVVSVDGDQVEIGLIDQDLSVEEEQLLQIGTEIVQVNAAESDRVTVVVNRGQLGTPTQDIQPGDTVDLYTLTQVGTLAESPEATSTEITISMQGDGYDLVQDATLLQIGDEGEREVVNITNLANFEYNITVSRGTQGTEAASHELGESVGLLEPVLISDFVEQRDTTIVLDIEDRVPFNNEQFIWVDGEVMQIVDRGSISIDVERGLDDTPQVAHDPEQSFIFAMTEPQIRPLQPIESVQSIEQVAWAELDVNYIAQGDEVEIFDQVWQVGEYNTAGFDATCVGQGEYRLDRFDQFRTPRNLSTGDTITAGPGGIQWEVLDVDGDAITAQCVLDEAVNLTWRNVDGMVRNSQFVQFEGQQWRITDFNENNVRIERCDPGQTSEIIVDEGYGRVFFTEQVVSVGDEIMQVQEATRNSLTVERCLDDTNGYGHEEEDGRVSAIRISQDTSLGEFFSSTQWQPQIGDFGIWPLLTATLIVSAIAMLVAVPMGLGAAIYLSEYAPRRVSAVLTPILEILAGIPTVVYGFFALTWMSPALATIFGSRVEYYNMLSAGLVVGILIIPYIASLSRDALTAVPRALREASYGLGATKLETTVRVVLPAAASGVFAAFIIAVSRAIGETMIVAIAAGSGPNFTFNVFAGAETMTGHIARISGGDLSYDTIDYNSIFAIAALLFIMTLSLNLLSNFISRRLRENY